MQLLQKLLTAFEIPHTHLRQISTGLALSVFRSGLTNSPRVVKLQSQVVPVFIIRWYHRLQGTWEVSPPTVTQVHNSVLAPTQLSAELRLACHKTRHHFFTPPKHIFSLVLV